MARPKEPRQKDSPLLLLPNTQIVPLINKLFEESKITDREHSECISKRHRSDKLKALMAIMERKRIGQHILQSTINHLLPHEPDEQVQKGAANEKEVIGKLMEKIESLEKEIEEKNNKLRRAQSVKDLANLTGVTGIMQPLDGHKSREIFYNRSDQRTLERESLLEERKDDKKNIGELQKKNAELNKELEILKEKISHEAHAIKVVEELEEQYPYIKQVLGCPLHHVMHPEDSTITIPIYCLEMKFHPGRFNPNFCHITPTGQLVNKEGNTKVEHGYKKYQGTVGSIPIMIPLTTSGLIPPVLQYWETHTEVEMDEMLLSFQPLFEVGVCEEGWLDKMSWIYKQPRSWSIRVSVCRAHRWGICSQIWANQAQHGLCHTHAVTNMKQNSATLSYGIIVDVGSGRVIFLDLNKERHLHTFSVKFRETLYPVFGMDSFVHRCSLKMELVCGTDVNLTDNKKRLIQKALTTQQPSTNP